MRPGIVGWAVVLTIAVLCAAVACVLWQEPLLAAAIGVLSGSAIRGAQQLGDADLAPAQVTGWLFGTAAGLGAGLVSYGTWGQLWLAILVGLVVGTASGALLSVVAWLVAPYHVEVDRMLGSGPEDVLWRYRSSRRWARFSTWVKQRSEGRSVRPS